MASKTKFEVFISGGSTSVDEYRQAMAAPKSELPELNDDQKFVAKKLGLSEEEYRRGVLADHLGHSRMLVRGENLGQVVQSILDGNGGGYHVDAIKAEMVNGRWLVRISGNNRDIVVSIPRELADDALDSGAGPNDVRLRSCVLGSLRSVEAVQES